MKKLYIVLISIFSTSVFAQDIKNYKAVYSASPDLGVENGWGGWVAQEGYLKFGNQSPVFFVPQSPITPRFVIKTGAGFDSCSVGTNSPAVPLVAPGFGNASILLGEPKKNDVDGGCTNNGNYPPPGTSVAGNGCSEKITYSFNVSVNDTNFVFANASFFISSSNGHLIHERPFAEIYMLDGTDTVSNSHYRYIGNPNILKDPLSGYYLSSTCTPTFPSDSIFYKPWTLTTIKLSQYIGRTLTLVVVNSDCTKGGHSAWSYWDFTFNSVLSMVTTPDSCNNHNGTVTAIMLNGTSPFIYNWSNGQSTQTITGLSVGEYSVTVTDANQLSLIAKANVIPYTFFLFDSIAHVNCYGGSDGEAKVIPYHGTAPYTYVWSNGQTTQKITGLSAGIYSVTVSDSEGCISSKSMSVPGIPLIAANIGATPASCPSCPNGSATTNATGGTSPYTYQWSPTGNTTKSISALLPGTYTVCITDRKGCTICDSVIISFPNGVGDILNNNLLFISPNPTSGNLYLDFGNKNFGTVQIIISDLTGRAVLKKSIEGKSKQVIDISENCKKGIYFLTIQTNEGKIVKKIIFSP